MKSSLLTRPATMLLLAAALAGGPRIAAFAATTTGVDQGTTTTAPNAGTAGANAATPGATNTPPNAQSAAGTQENLEQMAEQRINDLHGRLNITAKQQGVWDSFARVMRENARQLDQAYEQRAENFDSLDAVDNMRSYAKIEQMRARDVQKLVPAFQKVYAELTPAQKQEADTLFRNRAQAAQQQHQSAATANR